MKKIVALFGKNKEEILSELKKIEGYEIELVEIRADYVDDLSIENLSEIISAISEVNSSEIILTLRTKREGGYYSGLDYSTRVQSFLDLKVDYIDLQINELTDQNMEEMVKYAKGHGIKTVLSVHHMERGVSKGIFTHYLNKAKKFDADYVKIVDFPETKAEVIYKLILSGRYASENVRPKLISISMGANGVISRYETNIYKPEYTFINISDNVNVGQITLEDMEERLGQKDIINFYTSMDSVLGKLYLYSDLNGLNQICFEKPRSAVDKIIDIEFEDAILSEAVNQLNEYFTKQRKTFEIKTSVRESEFDCKVYEALKEIPYGETISYEDLAKKMGFEDVDSALKDSIAKNKLPIIIPCHRVIESSGNLGEFIGGRYRKQLLIALEKED